MSGARKAWIVAASIGAVEALKDQGICRWNHSLRSLQQYTKNNLRSFTQGKLLSAQSSSAAISSQIKEQKRKETVRKVMELSCLGPNTVRF